jgi:hypothetical protein
MHFIFVGFERLQKTAIISLNSINQLMFVMVKCYVLLEVWTEFLNIIYTSFGSKGLNAVVLYVLLFLYVCLGSWDELEVLSCLWNMHSLLFAKTWNPHLKHNFVWGVAKFCHRARWHSLYMIPFWNIVLCSLIEVDQYFSGAYCLHHQYSVPYCWRQYTALRCQSNSVRLHSAMLQKAVFFIFATIWTWNIKMYYLFLVLIIIVFVILLYFIDLLYTY